MAAKKTSQWTVITAADALARGFPLTAADFPTPRPDRGAGLGRTAGKRPPNQTYSVYLRHADGTLYAAALTRGTNAWHTRNARGTYVWSYDVSNDYLVYRWDSELGTWRELSTTDGGPASVMLGDVVTRTTPHGNTYRTTDPTNTTPEECQSLFTASFKNHMTTYLKKQEKEGSIICTCQKLSDREAERTYPTFAIPHPTLLNNNRQDERAVWVVCGVGKMKLYAPALFHVWLQGVDGGQVVHSVWVWGRDDDDWQEVEALRGKRFGYGGGQVQKKLEAEYRARAAVYTL